jgi:spore coat protein U-like protein
VLKLNDRKKSLVLHRQKEEVMKKSLVILAAMALVIAMVGGVFAADAKSGDVAVNASVSVKCNDIAGGPLDLAIDPSTTSAVASTGTAATVQCTRTTPFTVTADSLNGVGGATGTSPLTGALKDTVGSNSNIPYTLAFTTSFTGAGFGSATPTELVAATAASVTAAAAQASQAGTYQDTVTLTISY